MGTTKESQEPAAVDHCFVLPTALGTGSWRRRIEKSVAGLPDGYGQIAQTYCTALRRMNTTALLPYQLTWLGEAAVQEAHFLHSSAIKALDELDPFEDDLEAKVPPLAFKEARQALNQFIESEEGRSTLHARAQQRLLWSTRLEHGRLLQGGQDLLLQSITVIWAAFETFVSDTVRLLLNQTPAMLRLLMADEDAKRRVMPRTKWSLLDLLEMGLDLSAQVGDLVLSENDLSDYASIKAVVLPLLESPAELREAVNASDLFMLGKLRNVIAHRGGVADMRFERETGGRWKAGETVTVTTQDVATYVDATALVVELMLIAIQKN